MANRDYDDSQYDRSEGRIDHRDEQPSIRDQSNRGSREWDRRGDDFRRDASSGRERSYGSDYQNRDQYQQRTADYGQSRSGGNYTGSYGNDYGGSYGGSYGDRDGQRLGQQDWNRSVGSYRQGGQTFGRQDYARQEAARPDYGLRRDWDDRSQQGSSSQDWRSYAPTQPDYRSAQRSDTNDWGPGYRGDNPLRSQERNREEWNRTLGAGSFARSSYGASNYGQPSYGPREEEGWGEQIRHAGQQVVNRVKRAFRGPKGYKRSDERIREDVNDRLAQQYDFDPSDVEVQVSGGEVTLTGTVQSRHEKFVAEEIADDVSGVSEVHNQLRVRSEDQTSTTGISSSTTSAASTTLVEGQKNRNSPRA